MPPSRGNSSTNEIIARIESLKTRPIRYNPYESSPSGSEAEGNAQDICALLGNKKKRQRRDSSQGGVDRYNRYPRDNSKRDEVPSSSIANVCYIIRLSLPTLLTQELINGLNSKRVEDDKARMNLDQEEDPPRAGMGIQAEFEEEHSSLLGFFQQPSPQPFHPKQEKRRLRARESIQVNPFTIEEAEYFNSTQHIEGLQSATPSSRCKRRRSPELSPRQHSPAAVRRRTQGETHSLLKNIASRAHPKPNHANTPSSFQRTTPSSPRSPFLNSTALSPLPPPSPIFNTQASTSTHAPLPTRRQTPAPLNSPSPTQYPDHLFATEASLSKRILTLDKQIALQQDEIISAMDAVEQRESRGEEDLAERNRIAGLTRVMRQGCAKRKGLEAEWLAAREMLRLKGFEVEKQVGKMWKGKEKAA